LLTAGARWGRLFINLEGGKLSLIGRKTWLPVMLLLLLACGNAMAACKSGTTGSAPIHPPGFSEEDGWLYETKKIREIGFLAALAFANDSNVEGYLKSQGADSCTYVYIANFTSHGDFVTKAYNELVIAASYFVYKCPAYSIDVKRLAEITYYFDILALADGNGNIPPYKPTSKSAGKLSGGYWMRKRLSSKDACTKMYRERFRHVYFVS
jgi:hypothetical protein